MDTEHLMPFLNSYNLQNKRWLYGRSFHGICFDFTMTIDSWFKAIGDGKLVECLMVDFRKAIDLGDRSILLQNLRLYKCYVNSLSWFHSYLSNSKNELKMFKLRAHIIQ